ncbi:MAG: prepilin-type N-terminal cleavage/methylation domain-containing protein [Oscillospiraceae bacterium]|nr:prepilin-type N-terminal cleavage/methylation domain-containing protein [Oscillospiraceae bacterium]
MKKIKRLLACRRNGGFTLAEMVISCALLGILMLGMFMFISPILDTVTSTNESTRASNAAETIEYYISRSIRNAAYISVFTDTNFTDVQTKASDIIMALKNKGSEANYELKCISIRYMKDTKSQENKYFICNETFSSGGSLDSSATVKVFDACYFEGIYPKIILSQVQQEQDDGSKKDMPAVQINVEVYDDPQMRRNGGSGYSGLVFSGTGYTILRNIELSQQDKTLSQPFNIVSSAPIGKTLGTLPVSLSSGDPDDKAKEMETYIIYVERTLATTPTAP